MTLNPKESVIVWSITKHGHYRRQYGEIFERDLGSATVVRLRPGRGSRVPRGSVGSVVVGVGDAPACPRSMTPRQADDEPEDRGTQHDPGHSDGALAQVEDLLQWRY